MASMLHPGCLRPARGCARWLFAALCLTGAGGPGLARAQDAPTSGPSAEPPRPVEQTVEQIVVTATRRATPLSEVAASFTLLDQETIQLDQSFEALELLRDVPGFSVVQTGSRGGTTSLFVRGGEANHNLVLVDGVQINRGGGEFDFANLSLAGVERIEIVRGPAAALYGSDAISSVIHVITRRGEGPLRGSIRALVGSDRTHEVGAHLSGGGPDLAYSLDVSRYATDGALSLNNDAQGSSFRGRLDLGPAQSVDVSLTSSYIASSFDFPTDFVAGTRGGFPPVDPDQGRESFEWTSSLDVEYVPSPELTHRLRVGYTRGRFDDFDGLDPIPSDLAESRSRSREVRKGIDYQVAWEHAATDAVDVNLTLNLEYERETFTQSRRRGEARAAQSAARRNRAASVLAGLEIRRRIFVNASVRIDDQSEFGSEWTGAVSSAVRLGGGTKLRAAYAKGFKEPTFGENFGFPPRTAGNPDLSPEKSRSFEVGVDGTWLAGRVRGSLTYFRTEFDDLIAFVRDPSGGTFLNVQASRSQGLEAQLSLELAGGLEVGASYTRLRTRVLDGGGVGGTAFEEGEELLRRPTHSGSLSASFTGERGDVRLTGTLVGSRSDRDFGPSPERRVRNGAYLRVDAAGRWRLWTSPGGSVTRLLMRADNLLDREYEEAFGFEAPDRRVLVGFEIETP